MGTAARHKLLLARMAERNTVQFQAISYTRLPAATYMLIISLSFRTICGQI